jgi:hypothetical protein
MARGTSGRNASLEDDAKKRAPNCSANQYDRLAITGRKAPAKRAQRPLVPAQVSDFSVGGQDHSDSVFVYNILSTAASDRIDRVLRGVLTWRYLSAKSGGAKVMLKNRFTSAAQRAAIEAGIVRANRKATNSERVVHCS